MHVEERTIDELHLIGEIDRSELVDVEYQVVSGWLVERPVTMRDVPGWDLEGDGEHSLRSLLAHRHDEMQRGGRFLVALDATHRVLGVAVVVPAYDVNVAQLSFLQVTRAHRRQGVATALWNRALEIALSASTVEMRISATPTGSAVGFYLSRGCVLAAPPDPRLVAAEPEDIQLVFRPVH